MTSQIYYGVYSVAVEGGGTGLGRNTFTVASGRAIETFSDIEEIERVLLEELRKSNSKVTNLFLVSWTPLKS